MILNRYDIEFIGLLNEIRNRIFYFSKEDVMKIKSWIKLLSSFYQTKEEKQNRNLYAIKLLNQMINGKLKKPFNNYCIINILKPLLPIDIRKELTEKFFNEINFKNIVNYGYQKQNQFLQTHSEFFGDINNNNNNQSKFEESFSFTSNADKNILTQRYNNVSNMNTDRDKDNDMNECNNIDDEYDVNIEDNDKLYEIIEQLEKYINETDIIIENQNIEIHKLINILNNLLINNTVKEDNK